MGRKRDKGFDGPKRRTILQINKSSLNSTSHVDSPSCAAAAGSTQKAHNPLGLLAHYGDSDDEGVDEDAPTPPRQTKGGFIGVDGNKPKNEMDEKVADFLAEIDALDPEEEEQKEEHPSELPADTTNNTTQDAEPPAPPPPPDNGGWQELLDENTNCIYYWNTISNDVTWEMPPGFQTIVAAEGTAPSVEEPAASEPAAPQVSEPAKPEPVVEEKPPKVELPLPEKPKVEVETKKVVIKDESVVKDEVEKKEKVVVKEKEKAKMVTKAPAAVADMFADEEVKKPSKKMPVYGSLKVDYDIDSQEEEEEEEEEPPKPSKPGPYAMFVKGDVLPATKNKEPSVDEEESLSHYDVSTLDDDSQESHMSQTNGDAGGGEEEEEDEGPEVMEMDGGDDIDIDQQLELALERKKAELAQLEEMEKGVSPAPKRKMSSPLSIYDEKGEVNLLSFKKKRLENLKGQKNVQKCDQATQCDEELSKVAAQDDKYQTVKKLKAEEKLKKELSELGSTLTSKLEFLGQSRKGLTKLQILLVEVETRILDWREGALDGKHLLRKLQSADWELQRKENEAVPPGWTCTWNRTHKQYFYTNSATGDSQWDYPTEAMIMTDQQDGLDGSGDGKDSRVMFNRASSQDDTVALARGSTAMLHGSVTNVQLTAPSVFEAAPPPPSRTATPPPPAAPSPEPPPPLPVDAPPLPRDPPPPGTGPDLPPLPPSPPPPMPPSPPMPPDDSDDDESEGPGSRPLTPPPLPPLATAATFGAPPPAPPENDGTVIGKPQVLYTNAPTPAPGMVIAKSPEISGGIDGTPLGDYGGAPTMYGAPPGPPKGAPSGGAAGNGPPAAQQPVKKKTKKAKKSSTVKKKMPSSLVAKWKQIQEAQAREEEEKRRREEEEEMVLDPSIVTKKRIEEWKKQQMSGGNINIQSQL